MKSYLLSFTFLACSLCLGIDLDAQVRDLESFDQLRISGGISVNLIASNEEKADIDMVKGDIDRLITEVRNGTLHIKFKNKAFGWGNNNNSAKIDLYYKKLNSLDISSGSSLKGKDVLKASSLDIDVSSGSSCTVSIEADEATFDVSSGSTLRVKGSTRELDVDVSSGSTMDATGLEAKIVDVDASSGSTAKVWATQKLSADANSGSTIRYKGNPSQKDIESGKYSGGSVKSM